eukprot:CAMPEP_0175473302 /NCGR_PEP_ID=MMETSP0095-20121207/74314_1 /TAXON_ID=311494 /ORGANISM="Alexandrium monilatum, Strain CCMP3105" /LENGTH=103 /DNA_ID=CAMNT_0016774799 /DNA_START=162 /DNA_END=469 /DNA_ORIENTATION=+
MFFQDGLTGSAWGDWALYTDSPLRAQGPIPPGGACKSVMFFQDGLTGSAWGDWALYTDSPLRAQGPIPPGGACKSVLEKHADYGHHGQTAIGEFGVQPLRPQL